MSTTVDIKKAEVIMQVGQVQIGVFVYKKLDRVTNNKELKT